jgi:hypothetical protein
MPSHDTDPGSVLNVPHAVLGLPLHVVGGPRIASGFGFVPTASQDAPFEPLILHDLVGDAREDRELVVRSVWLWPETGIEHVRRHLFPTPTHVNGATPCTKRARFFSWRRRSRSSRAR